MWTDEQYLNSAIVRNVKEVYKVQTVGLAAARALVVLDAIEGGLHHMFGFPKKQKRDPRYWNGVCFEYLYDHDLSTWDFNRLTVLVLFAHDHCLRIEISPHTFSKLMIRFHNRERDGKLWQRHPTIMEAITLFRRGVPERLPGPEKTQ